MSNKDQESKQDDELEIEPSSVDRETNSSIPTEPDRELSSSDTSPQQEDRETESSSEDLLEDVRRSLIEEETDQKKETKWWQRIGRKPKRAEPEPSLPDVEIGLADTSLQNDLVEAPLKTTEPREYEDQIEDLIQTLQTEQKDSVIEVPSSVAEVEAPPEPEPEIDIEQLKEQAFRPRTPDEAAQSESDVRSIALEGGEEVFVEVEARRADTFKERREAFENALKPYRTYILITVGFLGVVAVSILSLLLYNAYQQSRPQPVQEVSNLPYPVGVSLPGGWSFNLGRGTLQAGKWEPSGPEWLEGTEVCRWVSLPWSRQLEAVIRTLNQNDPIELSMSNNDRLTYGVYSVFEMTPEEIQQVDTNSPCLLLILTGADSEKRWVLTALP